MKQLRNTLSVLNVSQLVYPIMLAQQAGEMSESKACELLGMTITHYRTVKFKAIEAIVSILEKLPSPLTLLLEGIKDKPGS